MLARLNKERVETRKKARKGEKQSNTVHPYKSRKEHQ